MYMADWSMTPCSGTCTTGADAWLQAFDRDESIIDREVGGAIAQRERSLISTIALFESVIGVRFFRQCRSCSNSDPTSSFPSENILERRRELVRESTRQRRDGERLHVSVAVSSGCCSCCCTKRSHLSVVVNHQSNSWVMRYTSDGVNFVSRFIVQPTLKSHTNKYCPAGVAFRNRKKINGCSYVQLSAFCLTATSLTIECTCVQVKWQFFTASIIGCGALLLRPRERLRSIVMSTSVSVCLSARISPESHERYLPNFCACCLWA